MPTPDDPDITAGELALGVLEGEDRAAALRRVLADPRFAREVERWRTHLAGLFAAVDAVPPGEAVDRRIIAPGLVSPVVPAPAPVRRTTPWAWATAASSAVAAALLIALVTRPEAAPLPAPAPIIRAVPVLVAVVSPTDGNPFGAVYYPATKEVRLSGNVTVPQRRDAELWAIGGDGVPRAIGLLGRGRLVVPQAVLVQPGTTLAISIEQLGGSPKPTPVGPVVAQGKLSPI